VATTTESIEQRAIELARHSDQDAAVLELVQLADGDRDAVEAARNRLARRLHGHAGDYPATLALGLLNKAIIKMGWVDPYDWKVRWHQRFRKP
jgi:hypothetical protein